MPFQEVTPAGELYTKRSHAHFIVMKMSAAAIAACAGMLLGVGIATVTSSKQAARLRNDIASLRLSLEQCQQSATEDCGRLKSLVDTLSTEVAEVHQLHGETARLQRELAQSQRERDNSAKVDRSNASSEPISTLPDSGIHTLDQAPAHIRTAILGECGNQSVAGFVRKSQEDGITSYHFKGQLPDGRAVRIRLTEDGSLLEKATQVSSDALPSHIQALVPQFFGEATTTAATEILDGGKVSYEVLAKRPDAAMQINVRDDGTVLGYSAKFRPPK